MQALLIAAMAAGLLDPAGFRAQLEAVAGQPVRLDPRIAIPACPGGHRLMLRATSVDATCPETGWRLVVPVAAMRAAAAEESERLVRRGSAVAVEAAGSHYSVRIDGVAESDGGAGDMVRVRNARTGQRVLARVSPDGRLLMDDR